LTRSTKFDSVDSLASNNGGRDLKPERQRSLMFDNRIRSICDKKI